MIHRVATLLVLILISVVPASAMADLYDDPAYFGDVITGDSSTYNVIVIYSTKGEYSSVDFSFMPVLEAELYNQESFDGEDMLAGGGVVTGDVSMANITDEEFGVYFENSPKMTNSVQVHIEDRLLSLMLSIMDLKYYLIRPVGEPMQALDCLPAENFEYDESRDQYFQLNVPEGKKHLWIDLNWAGSDMAYKLTVFPPDAVMGPFDDSYDGKIDQRIYLDISAKKYLTSGLWYYKVTNLNGGYSNFNFTNYYGA